MSKNELYQPFTFSVSYKNISRLGELKIFALSETQSAHPDANKSFSNNFESKLRSSISYKISKNKLSLESYFNDASISANNFYNYNITLFGTNIAYSFIKDWSIYYNSIIPLSGTQENTLGTFFNSGLKGKFSLFQGNMKINFHIWADSYINGDNNFSYNPFLSVFLILHCQLNLYVQQHIF